MTSNQALTMLIFLEDQNPPQPKKSSKKSPKVEIDKLEYRKKGRIIP